MLQEKKRESLGVVFGLFVFVSELAKNKLGMKTEATTYHLT